MINLEHRLTIDDLIVEYMMYKVKNGYEPYFYISEFMDFLNFFKSKMEVLDTLDDGEKLFKRFFERKIESDWSTTIDWHTNKRKAEPHMDMEYSDKNKDFIIKPNYRFSDYDRSVITTYFMDGGRTDDYKGKKWEIRNTIGKYLSLKPKRIIDETIKVEGNDIEIGKYISAEIFEQIWDSYVESKIKYDEWPRQCRDINKYLFDIDLASIIKVDSIKNELIDLYDAFSKRIAILYNQDKKLKVCSYTNGYLARSNYELLVNGYEKTIGIAFGPYQKSLEFDLENFTFKESHEMPGVYDWDDDPDIEVNTSSIGNDKVKKLVKNIEILKKNN